MVVDIVSASCLEVVILQIVTVKTSFQRSRNNGFLSIVANYIHLILELVFVPFVYSNSTCKTVV